ncbi:uncharacterized protein FTOL_10480 [Fusarium torulosum]|uniref:Uncharacterized protein n=1 Tax=Fusarium torulosum TaxID=33205 RepID=A0AAE8SLY4_9HYPO|nr:uncharacterized protein FTOL_10480 [Fusarium torulosum]
MSQCHKESMQSGSRADEQFIVFLEQDHIPSATEGYIEAIESHYQDSKQLLIAGCIMPYPRMLFEYSVRIVPSRENK